MSKKTTGAEISKTQKSVTHKKEKQNSKIEDNANFQHEIERFITEIDSLEMILDPALDSLASTFKKSLEQFLKYTYKKEIKEEKDDETISFHLHPSDYPTFKKLRKEMTSGAFAYSNIPQILFCSLVHFYDAYLGRLLRCAFYAKPDILNSSEKTITFSDLASFTNIDEARESLIQREIESVIRESHVDQFSWMERKFGIPLRKELDIWPTFIELTERRNLFVHCGGVVSKQYLTVCKNHGVMLQDNLKSGDQLTIQPSYFKKAFECIYEISIKLGHVLWRKLKPEQLDISSYSLHETTFDLLYHERYNLAIKLLTFSTEIMKKYSSDSSRRVDRINLAIAYKFSGKEKEMNDVLSTDDWSACGENFEIAILVLNNEIDKAAKLMKIIGTEGKVRKEDYASWPLFKEFRKSKEFLQSYRELFGDDFILTENKENNDVIENAGGDNLKIDNKKRAKVTSKNVNKLPKVGK